MSYFSSGADDFDPDDGHYPVEIYDASAFEGQDGREWAKVVLQITSGEHAGRRFDHFMNLNNPFGLQLAQEALVAYGLDVEQIENFGDLQQAMPALVGTRADVTVTHKNDYRNTRVTRTITGETDVPADQQSFAHAAGTSTTSTGDDDIPF